MEYGYCTEKNWIGKCDRGAIEFYDFNKQETRDILIGAGFECSVRNRP